MAERGDVHPRPEHDEDGPEETGRDADEQLRRAAEQERHRLAARRFFEAMPLYRIDGKAGDAWSLRQKSYDYWPNRPPAAATRWRVLSSHQTLEEAERRLERITAPPIHYDERGRLARAPEPTEEERAVPPNPWRS